MRELLLFLGVFVFELKFLSFEHAEKKPTFSSLMYAVHHESVIISILPGTKTTIGVYFDGNCNCLFCSMPYLLDRFLMPSVCKRPIF